jgi:hypothetical protein
MKKLLVLVVALLGLAAVAVPAQAFGCKPSCAPPPCEVKYEDRVVTCYKPVMKEREVKCVTYRIVPREVVETRKCTVLVPEPKEETRKCVTFKMVPKEVEREIQCCHLVTECYTDPCTGCVRTTCKPVWYTKKVTQVVCEAVPEEREYKVTVCHFRPEERTYTCKRIVCDYIPQEVVKKVCYCEMVPYQVTVKVAVCVPCK